MKYVLTDEDIEDLYQEKMEALNYSEHSESESCTGSIDNTEKNLKKQEGDVINERKN